MAAVRRHLLRGNILGAVVLHAHGQARVARALLDGERERRVLGSRQRDVDRVIWNDVDLSRAWSKKERRGERGKGDAIASCSRDGLLKFKPTETHLQVMALVSSRLATKGYFVWPRTSTSSAPTSLPTL